MLLTNTNSERNMVAENRPHDVFQIGARVRLNKLGKSRSPRILAETGEVIKLPKPGSGGRAVSVLFDGNKLTTRLHRSYLELDCDKDVVIGS